jgi:hypothetical protein
VVVRAFTDWDMCDTVCLLLCCCCADARQGLEQVLKGGGSCRRAMQSSRQLLPLLFASKSSSYSALPAAIKRAP